MLRIVFMCSGGGGNLRFVHEVIRLGLLGDAEKCGVITDRECAAGLFAKQQNIPVMECDFSESNQPSLKTTLMDLCPGIIVTNVHKIISVAVVELFRGKLINLHYSLLPAFGGVIGAKAITQALEYGAKVVGTTAHLVDHRVDAGPPVVQAVIPVMPDDELSVLMDIVFRVGCISLLTSMQIISEDRNVLSGAVHFLSEVSGRSVMFSPSVASVREFQE